MDISLTHVIGTIALMGLLISTGLAYSIITSYVETEITKQQMDQIAEHVALNLVEIVNLVNFANFLNNATMMKTLKLPSDLACLITLVNETGQGRGYCVVAQIAGRNGVSGTAQIPINSTQSGLTFMVDSEGTLNVDPGTVQYSGSVYSSTRFVVWGWKKDDYTTWVGIGIYQPQGGN